MELIDQLKFFLCGAWGRAQYLKPHDEVTPSMEKALDDQQGNINALRARAGVAMIWA